MIKRIGFVSNSSSSSFIIGYGIIKDRQKFNNYIKENKINIDAYGVKVKNKFDLIKDWEKELTGGNHTEIYIPDKLIEEGDLFIVEIQNNEEDACFIIYDEDGEYIELDYSIAKDIDFYDSEQQAIINLFNDKDIIDENNSECMYGAERNG